MAHIQKIVIVRYVIDVPGPKGKTVQKRASKGDPGAYPVKEESSSYYLFDGGKRIKKLWSDRKASNDALTKYEREKERGEAGMTDRFSAFRTAKTGPLVEEFLAWFVSEPGNDKYKGETSRLLRKDVKAIAPDMLGDLTAEAVQRYLAKLKKPDGEPVAPNTKKKHHSALSVFATWLFTTAEYTRENVMLRVPIPKGGVQNKDKFRSLRLKELRELLKVARKRPLNEALMVRRGPRKGQLGANVRPEVQDALKLVGRERSLVYRTAALTGLRRAELGKLLVRYLKKPKGLPFPILDLPGSVTKNGKPARLWVLPRLAKRLVRWAKDTGRGPDDLLFVVPDDKVWHRDREAAGIPLLTERGKASFHSLRLAGNVLLRKAKIPVTTRKLFMRHSDIRLTDATYDDALLLDMREVVPTLEKYKLA
jgi:hypothetical protein